MNTITAPSTPELFTGQRLSREEYEHRYTLSPNIRAELLDGIVYIMASPISAAHAAPHSDLATALGLFSWGTKGVRSMTNPTIRIGLSSDPEPDGVLYIEEEYGGATRISDDQFIEGAPELIFEIARSSKDYDQTIKMPIYLRHGVREFLLWNVGDRQIDWYAARNGKYEPIKADTDGIHRSEVFPGLWLDLKALLRHDSAQILATIMQGLTSPEHQLFVQHLEANRITP